MKTMKANQFKTRPGQTLPNGALLIAASPIKFASVSPEETCMERAVLAIEVSTGQYASWIEVAFTDSDVESYTTHGGYFEHNFERAVKCFQSYSKEATGHQAI